MLLLGLTAFCRLAGEDQFTISDRRPMRASPSSLGLAWQSAPCWRPEAAQAPTPAPWEWEAKPPRPIAIGGDFDGHHCAAFHRRLRQQALKRRNPGGEPGFRKRTIGGCGGHP